MDSDDEETFVTIGTTLELSDEDEFPKKPPSAHEKRERGRFHGAFTGGFSAGYFNTVGSKDGFTPSTFVSSREKKSEVKAQLPEDFMDDEDFGVHGIAPRKLQTSSTFSSEERRKRRFEQAKAVTSGSLFSGTSAITDLILPQKATVGIKLLRKLGWKEGQGIGPKTSRTQRKKMAEKQESVSRIYGCSLPSQSSSNEESEEEMDGMTFAPKDMNPITFDPKANVHGIGYKGLNPSLALPSYHVDPYEPPPITKSGRKGISGHAFGVGALEEDDDDIYTVDHMSNYDFSGLTDQAEEKEDKLGWTAPGMKKRSDQPVPVGYIGKVLEGFTLSSKTLKQKKSFPSPQLPRGYRPAYKSRKKFFEPGEKDSGKMNSDVQNAVSRGLALGETPIFKSVFDLVSKEDLKKMEDAKHTSHVLEHQRLSGSNSVTPLPVSMATESSTTATTTTTSEEVTGRSSGVSSKTKTPAPATMATTGVTLRSYVSMETKIPNATTATMATAGGVIQRLSEPLYKGSGMLFQPFSKDPKKQERYEKYLALIKQGQKDAYPLVAEGHMTEWEREHEESEFAQAAKLYKPMPGMIASRFTRAKYKDDETNVDTSKELSKPSSSSKSDQEKAAAIKMYGALTREVFEWHPDPVVCKRFNVANPYLGSTVVGLPGSRRDKISIFNFLDFSGPAENTVEEPKALPAPPLTEMETQEKDKQPVSFKVQSRNKQLAAGKSIFSGLFDEEKGKNKEWDKRNKQDSASSNTVDPTAVSKKEETEQSETPENPVEEVEKPSMDLFEAIFGDTDSEEEEEEDVNEDDDANEDTNKAAPEEVSVSEQEVSNATMGPKEAEQSNLLPGAPVRIETTEERLSPMATVEGAEDEYGPALPLSLLSQGASKDLKTSRDSTASASQRDSARHRSKYKEKHKHKHKKEKKSKKSKHKKSERRKSKKKKKDADSDYEASGSSETEDSEENVPSNREIINKLKSLSSNEKLSAKSLLYDKYKS